MIKKILFLITVTAIFVAVNVTSVNKVSLDGDAAIFSDLGEEYSWAHEAVNSLCSKGIISGMGDNKFMPQALVTKEQLATMIAKACGYNDTVQSQTYVDVPWERWSFPYVENTKDIIIKTDDLAVNQYDPERPQNRSEVAAACIKAVKGGTSNDQILASSFHDYGEIPAELAGLVATATECGIVKGSDGFLRPLDYVTRAETAVMIYRMLSANVSMKTPLVDYPHISVEDAQRWAQRRGAHQRFIDVAPLYWKYGELTGINPEIMYGQAAKETNFGKYTGNVKPEQNNWAGIKIYSPSGDKPEDHETFPSADDGVRAHFNHMCAYVGLAPIGTPHDRYNIVKRLSWAGTVKYAEELSTKWAPAKDYGQSLVKNYVMDMRKVK